MSHRTAQELKSLLQEAETLVKVGGRYFHYKNPDKFYTVLDLVIIEATVEVGVVYRAEYDGLEEFKFVRPIGEFMGEVEVDGKMVNRFTLID